MLPEILLVELVGWGAEVVCFFLEAKLRHTGDRWCSKGVVYCLFSNTKTAIIFKNSDLLTFATGSTADPEKKFNCTQIALVIYKNYKDFTNKKV